MNENKKTIIYAAIAVVLLVLAIFSSPDKITPEAFLDQGEVFFPDFIDPNEATTLEVIGFDEATGMPKPFKVTFKHNRWTIPSHHDYPADAKNRLARTAAGIIDIKKEEFRTDNVSDHEACGVIDPLEEVASSSGRGQRVTIKGESDRVLADLIIGSPIPARRNFCYVRLPNQSRVYAAQVDVDLSTKFQDWIDTDLLRLVRFKINQIILKDYSIDERTGRVEGRDNLVLSKKDAIWTANRMSKNQVVDSAAVNNLLNSLTGLNIVGVRPKPPGLSANLKVSSGSAELTQTDLMSLQDKGFYLSRDGQLLSNEGELQVITTDGVLYTLRFGEVVYGSGLAVTAGGEVGTQNDKAQAEENRYLFITADFDQGFFKEPPKPEDTSFATKADSLWTDQDRLNKESHDKHNEWARKVQSGRQIAEELTARFADWYYVISSESYDKIDLTRADLVVAK
jgi:hypothetical protein